MSENASSGASSGGRNTRSRPPRTSTHTAVRIMSLSAGSESRGSRNPAGESPGTRYIRSRFSGQRPLFHVTMPDLRPTARSGRQYPAIEPSPWRSRRASRVRSPTSPKSPRNGSTPGGKRLSRSSAGHGSSKAGMTYSGEVPSLCARDLSRFSASPMPRSGPVSSSAINAGSRHKGAPATRQYSPKAQRGSGSPGYHLPCPNSIRPCGAKRACSRRSSRAAKRRLLEPSAV